MDACRAAAAALTQLGQWHTVNDRGENLFGGLPRDHRLGASPRATLHLLRAGRARAALDGRDFVIPDDMQALALPVLAHRLLPSAEAVVTRQPPEQVLAAIVDRVPLPQLR